MVRCPRCGQETDELEPVPVEAVSGDAGESAAVVKACSWCVHEITEG